MKGSSKGEKATFKQFISHRRCLFVILANAPSVWAEALVLYHPCLFYSGSRLCPICRSTWLKEEFAGPYPTKVLAIHSWANPLYLLSPEACWFSHHFSPLDCSGMRQTPSPCVSPGWRKHTWSLMNYSLKVPLTWAEAKERHRPPSRLSSPRRKNRNGKGNTIGFQQLFSERFSIPSLITL